MLGGNMSGLYARILLFCTCIRQWPLAAGVCRRFLEVEWISYFRDELSELGLEAPPDPELRNLVRQALRMGRRTIRGYGRTWAHENHEISMSE